MDFTIELAPWFPIYVQDFILDTAEFSNEEVGVYIRLLFHQWANKSLPSDMDRLARIASCERNAFALQWDSALHVKFKKDSNGRLVNPRLERTRMEFLEKSQSRSNSGRAAALARWEKENADKNADAGGNANAMRTQCHTDTDTDKKIYSEVIDYLNKKSGKDFKHKTPSTRRFINGRITDGHALDDFKKVIDTKCKQWKNDAKNNKWLRPSTLFNAEKFEGYLNETPKKRGKLEAPTG